MFAGMLSDRLGRKWVMIIAALLFSISGIWCAASSDFNHLIAARILGGIAIGVVSIVSPLYISEVAAAHYRGRLVSLYQVAVTVGFLGAYIANFYLLTFSQSGFESGEAWFNKIFVSEVWRGMLGMESVPAILFLITILFIPESPRWLIVAQKEDQARKVLQNIYLTNSEAQAQIEQTKAVLANEHQSSWSMLWQPGILKAVIIGVCIAMLGQFMGVNAVLYYGPSIFEDAGLSGGDSLFYQILIGAVNMITGILALLIIDKIGRKKLIYYGVSGMIVSLIAIGIYFVAGEKLNLSNTYLLFFFLAYIFFCAGSISAVIFCLTFRNVPHQDTRTCYVCSRTILMGWNLSDRTTYPLDVGISYPWRNILLICIHVYSLYADCMEIDAGNSWKDTRRNRIVLDWTKM